MVDPNKRLKLKNGPEVFYEWGGGRRVFVRYPLDYHDSYGQRYGNWFSTGSGKLWGCGKNTNPPTIENYHLPTLEEIGLVD